MLRSVSRASGMIGLLAAMSATAVLAARTPQSTAQTPPPAAVQTPAAQTAGAPAASTEPFDPVATAAKLSATWKRNPEFSTDTQSLTQDASSTDASGRGGGSRGRGGSGGGGGYGGGGGGFGGGGMGGGGFGGGGMGGGGFGGGGMGGGRGGGGERGATTESDSVRQNRVLHNLLLEPPSQVTIAATKTDVSITDDQDTTIAYKIDGKSEKVDLLIAIVPCTTSWKNNVLTMEFDGGNTKATATYALSSTGNQLIVSVALTTSNSRNNAAPLPPVKTVYDRVASLH